MLATPLQAAGGSCLDSACRRASPGGGPLLRWGSTAANRAADRQWRLAAPAAAQYRRGGGVVPGGGRTRACARLELYPL
jgi:hypothetical protein